MCWEINKWAYTQNTKKYRKVADKDIFVYKIGYKDGNGFSPYYRDEFIYNANMPNEEIKLYVNSSQVFDFRVDEGYHSYSGECICFYCELVGEEAFRINSRVKYNKGKKVKPIIFIEDIIKEDVIIGKFIIPKGTEYLENEEGEIVSSQLIWSGEYKYVNDIEFDSNFTEIKLKDICVGE